MSALARVRSEVCEYVSFQVSGQLLGISVARIQEVLPAHKITPVPLAMRSVAGLLNLRGQIVTAVDLRTRLDLPARAPGEPFMNVIVSDSGELFSLMVDSVGDVVRVEPERFAAPPPTLDECWKRCCESVCRLDQNLLVIVDVPSLLSIGETK